MRTVAEGDRGLEPVIIAEAEPRHLAVIDGFLENRIGGSAVVEIGFDFGKVALAGEREEASEIRWAGEIEEIEILTHAAHALEHRGPHVHEVGAGRSRRQV